MRALKSYLLGSWQKLWYVIGISLSILRSDRNYLPPSDLEKLRTFWRLIEKESKKQKQLLRRSATYGRIRIEESATARKLVQKK